jgi:hypothetical protein
MDFTPKSLWRGRASFFSHVKEVKDVALFFVQLLVNKYKHDRQAAAPCL